MPNASLGPAETWWFLGVTAVVLAIVATVFALRGAWLIVPFAGLELIALSAALIWCQRQNRYREVVCITDSRVTVETGFGRPQQSFEFRRPWLEISLRPAASRTESTRLVLSGGGNTLELGACLTDGERRQLAARLREVLHGTVAFDQSRARLEESNRHVH